MKAVATRGWLAPLLAVGLSGCMAQAPTSAQEPEKTPGGVPNLNQPISAAMTCGELRDLLKGGDKRTAGIAILWLDGYYSGRSGLAELPAGWVQTVSQGLGGVCAISVNEQRTVLDVIGQLHREYAGQR